MTNRPLKVAFWALLMSFGLSLVVVISDPRAVRVAILAKAEQSQPIRARGEETILVADNTATTPSTADAPATNPRPADSTPTLATDIADWPTIDGTPLRSAYVANSANQIPRPYDDVPRNHGDVFSDPPLVDTRPVSSPLGPRTTAEQQPLRRKTGATMIVVSPDQLQGRWSRSDEVELLPPPPEMEDDTDRLRLGSLTDEPAPAWEQPPLSAPDLSRQWQQAELLRLGQEVDRLADAQQISDQLGQLHEQQQQLLAMHQSLPVDRLREVIDLLHQQLTMVRETIPLPPRDQHSTSAMSAGATSALTGEASPTNEGRVSLQVTEAELEDILEMLERLSATPLGTLSAQETSLP